MYAQRIVRSVFLVLSVSTLITCGDDAPLPSMGSASGTTGNLPPVLTTSTQADTVDQGDSSTTSTTGSTTDSTAGGATDTTSESATESTIGSTTDSTAESTAESTTSSTSESTTDGTTDSTTDSTTSDDFEVIELHSIEPSPLEIGQLATVYGEGFSAPLDVHITGAVKLDAQVINEHQAQFIVPNDGTSGPVWLRSSDVESNPIEVVVRPLVQSISPGAGLVGEGLPGDNITLFGHNLMNVIRVRLGGKDQMLTSILPKQISFNVANEEIATGLHEIELFTHALPDTPTLAGQLQIEGPGVISLFPQENMPGWEVRINVTDLQGIEMVRMGDEEIVVEASMLGHDPYREMDYIIVKVPEGLAYSKQAIRLVHTANKVVSKPQPFQVIEVHPRDVIPPRQKLFREYAMPLLMGHIPPLTNTRSSGEERKPWAAIESNFDGSVKHGPYSANVNVAPETGLIRSQMEGFGEFISTFNTYRFQMKWTAGSLAGPQTGQYTGYYTPIQPCTGAKDCSAAALIAYDEKGRQFDFTAYLSEGFDSIDCDAIHNSTRCEDGFAGVVCTWNETIKKTMGSKDCGFEDHLGICGPTKRYRETCDEIASSNSGVFPRLYHVNDDGSVLVREHDCVGLPEDESPRDPVGWKPCQGLPGEPRVCGEDCW